MGFEYVYFRTSYEIKRKTGILKKQFPTNFISQKFISLSDWKKDAPTFFFESKKALNFQRKPNFKLEKEFKKYLDGELKYFNSQYFKIGKEYDWLTNPLTNYKYDITKHWTEIKDIDPNAGDIKYVWEKSRFSFLYMLIRYDYHFQIDNAILVFDEILSWITANPINKGPNYKCSQEISLRIMNWTFALYYYRNSEVLSEEKFQIIINSIYGQLNHVFNNINFSRKSVRNNHAITETLMLYLSGLLFPFFPEAKIWKKKGKQWFEEEIEYQIYEDGSYLQFSMNYHRVVVQLLTWAIILSEKNNENLNSIIYERSKKSVEFLINHLNLKNGWLPNYGANDGALFFKLNNCDYRDYRPQLNALKYALDKTVLYEDEFSTEDIYWYGAKKYKIKKVDNLGIHAFEQGGYYTIRDKETFTFIRCGRHKDRPQQADNLHVDIWINGDNVLLDSGSFLYNTDIELVKYFNGTKSHNTIMLGNYDQMLKGERFVWYYWSQALSAKLDEDNHSYSFKGIIKAFEYVEQGIKHKREIRKYKNKIEWEIIDSLFHNTSFPLVQIWNLDKKYSDKIILNAFDENGKEIVPTFNEGWFSAYYGIKEKSLQIIFSTDTKKIFTKIKWNAS